MNNSDQGTSRQNGIQPEIAASGKASAKHSKSKDVSRTEKKHSVSAKAEKQSADGSANTAAAGRQRVRLDDYQSAIRVWPD